MIVARYILIRNLLFLIVVILFNPALSQAQNGNQSEKMAFEFKETKTKLVLGYLIRMLKLDVEFDETVQNKPLTMSEDEITVRDFIELVMKQMRLVARMKNEKTILIFADTTQNLEKYQHLPEWTKT